MAAGKFTVINVAMTKVLDGTIKLGVDDLRLALCAATEPMSASWTGASGQGLYDDLTDEVTGTGYVAGGVDVDVTMSSSSGVVTVSSDPAVWTNATITAKYGVLYLAAGTQDVLGFFDLETTEPAGRVVTASDLTILWPNGLLTSQRV